MDDYVEALGVPNNLISLDIEGDTELTTEIAMKIVVELCPKLLDFSAPDSEQDISDEVDNILAARSGLTSSE
eukprot:gene29719-36811_t